MRSNVGLVVEHSNSSSCSAQIQSTWHPLHSVTKCLRSDQKLPLSVLDLCNVQTRPNFSQWSSLFIGTVAGFLTSAAMGSFSVIRKAPSWYWNACTIRALRADGGEEQGKGTSCCSSDRLQGKMGEAAFRLQYSALAYSYSSLSVLAIGWETTPARSTEISRCSFMGDNWHVKGSAKCMLWIHVTEIYVYNLSN